MAVTHLTNITVAIALASAPIPQAGFGTVLILVDEAAGTGNDLNGDRFRAYSQYDDAVADQSAGYITTATLAAVATAFAQRPSPASVLVGRVDTGAGTPETYPAALQLVINAGASFYAICADTRDGAVVEAIEADVAARQGYVFVSQSGDADWLTSGYPSAFADLEGSEVAASVYHDTATEWADVAWAANRLVYDPDVESAPWDGPVRSVASYAAEPTAAQVALAKANNINVGLPYGAETFFIDPGVNHNGRPMYEIVTRDWFRARLLERVAQLKVDHSARGQKIPITLEGQAKILNVINALLEQGVTAGHFTDLDNVSVRALTITDSDRTAQRLRFEGEAQLAASARLFSFSFNFGLTELAAA